ncbi:SPX domain-containing protein 3-like [Argentina anserina]|uniref:SPX domain-containing protein 3-like n=1 Tax=Argentina anserina TaxID=57926 RepID=UPI0021765815|nr:SPX domain-containing protein 3-like [Potentilla anserina]
MKFGKWLRQQMQETLPSWRDKFLSYDHLKKLVRLISAAPAVLTGKSGKAKAQFLYLLNNEIDKFNTFFMEREEDFIIRNEELQKRIKRVSDTWGPNGCHPSKIIYENEVRKLRKDIVDLHGEMVLLVNYSNVNYTGLAKILKKYDKQTGALLRLPFIQEILEQPFFTTDLISKLVKECEGTINAVFLMGEEEERNREVNEGTAVAAGDGIYRNTVVALLTLQEIRRTSSTYSHHSLPPINLPADFNLIQLVVQLNPPISIIL